MNISQHYWIGFVWGGAIRDGVPGVGSFRKVKRMAFTCAEGLKRLHREWLRASYTVNLLRDERHTRLLIRFRCADLKGHRHIGVLAQPRVIKGTATNITEITKEALGQFCTSNHGTPFLDGASWSL